MCALTASSVLIALTLVTCTVAASQAQGPAVSLKDVLQLPRLADTSSSSSLHHSLQGSRRSSSYSQPHRSPQTVLQADGRPLRAPGSRSTIILKTASGQHLPCQSASSSYTGAQAWQVSDDNAETSQHAQQRHLQEQRQAATSGTAADGSGRQATWFTTDLTRRRSISVLGDRARLHAAFNRYISGDNLTIAFVGGSITSGFASTASSPNYVDWVRILLKGALGPERLIVHNSGVSATGSSFMSVCHRKFIPLNSDIVFLEYAINDPEVTGRSDTQIDNVYRRYIERLIRSLLQYPRSPALVFLNAYAWFRPMEHDPADPGAAVQAQGPGVTHPINVHAGKYWHAIDRDLYEFASYYGLPMVSLRSAAYHLMRKGKPGYSVRNTIKLAIKRVSRDPAKIAMLERQLFFRGELHPGPVGYRVMGEVAANFVLYAMEDSKQNPLSVEEAEAGAEQLPPPMLPGNYESSSNRCLLGSDFKEAAVPGPGWAWVNEARAGQQDKWGFTSTTPGAVLRVVLDTTSVLRNASKADKTALSLSYLKSYEHMGMASVACEGGCSCNTTQLDGHFERHESQLYPHAIMATQSERCTVAITVLKDTGSGEHKVKVAGLMVNEESAPMTAGQMRGARAAAAATAAG